MSSSGGEGRVMRDSVLRLHICVGESLSGVHVFVSSCLWMWAETVAIESISTPRRWTMRSAKWSSGWWDQEQPAEIDGRRIRMCFVSQCWICSTIRRGGFEWLLQPNSIQFNPIRFNSIQLQSLGGRTIWTVNDTVIDESVSRFSLLFAPLWSLLSWFENFEIVSNFQLFSEEPLTRPVNTKANRWKRRKKRGVWK